MDGHSSYVQRIHKNVQKLASFSVHYEQHFKYTTSFSDPHHCMTFKVVKHINLTEEIKNIKHYFSLLMGEHLNIL